MQHMVYLHTEWDTETLQVDQQRRHFGVYHADSLAPSLTQNNAMQHATSKAGSGLLVDLHKVMFSDVHGQLYVYSIFHRLLLQKYAYALCCPKSLLLPENFTNFAVSGCNNLFCHGLKCPLNEQNITWVWWDPSGDTQNLIAYPDQEQHHTILVK